jgi:cysteinyl-tRNA synthetase
MSTKYLGQTFDIHGGGMDLMFPHHECEIAQNAAADGHDAARYWMHNNMITINGQKMGKSLGNFITLEEMFSGNHKALEQGYSPMTVRFFILQAHYRSTLDFSNDALKAAEKGLDRLMKAVETLNNYELRVANCDKSISREMIDNELVGRFTECMDDDLNSPRAIATLFNWVTIINELYAGSFNISSEDLAYLKEKVNLFVFEVLGLRDEKAADSNDLVSPLVETLLEIRTKSKANKDWATSDAIRDRMTAIGIRVKDRKDGGFDWEIE